MAEDAWGKTGLHYLANKNRVSAIDFLLRIAARIKKGNNICDFLFFLNIDKIIVYLYK